jgi:hypothetical protein
MEAVEGNSDTKPTEQIVNINEEVNVNVNDDDDNDLETDEAIPDTLDVAPVNFQMSVTSAESEQESAEPTAETPMIESRNGKLQYHIGDMEVVEVVSVKC